MYLMYLRLEVMTYIFVNNRFNNWNIFLDCRRGQSLVVWAISEGRQAARQVDEFFNRGGTGLPGPGGIVQPTMGVLSPV